MDQDPTQTPAPSDDDHQPPSPRVPWWSLNVPLIGVLILFLLTALFVPTETITSVQDFFGAAPVRVGSTFDEETARLDDALTHSPSNLDAERLDASRHAILLRRILMTGPMTADELRRAKEMLLDYEAKHRHEKDEAGRDALRHALARALSYEFPRLDEERVTSALDLFSTQYRHVTERSW